MGHHLVLHHLIDTVCCVLETAPHHEATLADEQAVVFDPTSFDKLDPSETEADDVRFLNMDDCRAECASDGSTTSESDSVTSSANDSDDNVALDAPVTVAAPEVGACGPRPVESSTLSAALVSGKRIRRPTRKAAEQQETELLLTSVLQAEKTTAVRKRQKVTRTAEPSSANMGLFFAFSTWKVLSCSFL